MSSDAAKNAYPDPPEGFTMAGEEARLVGLREAYNRGAREKAAEAWREGFKACYLHIDGGRVRGHWENDSPRKGMRTWVPDPAPENPYLEAGL